MNKVFLIYLDTENINKQSSLEIKYPKLQNRPQLGLLYLSSILKNKQVEVCLLEQSVTHFTENFLIKEIKEKKPIFIGFYSNFFFKEKVMHYIKKLRKVTSIPIVVGGPAYFEAEDYIKEGATAVFIGESENTLSQFYDCLVNNNDWSNIAGIYLSNNDSAKINKQPDLVENLDSIPFPDWRAAHISHYYDIFLFLAKRPYVTMITSRGCPFNCTFCAAPHIMGRKIRIRSVDNVFEEIRFLIKNYNIKYLAFQDDVFGLNISWFKEFLEKMISEDIKLNWSCFLHPFSFKKEREKIFHLMHKAGCNFVHFGLQSANKKILEGINRNPMESEELKENISIAKKNNIMVLIEFIFGLPKETEETIKENIYYSLNCNADLVTFNSLVILPGSRIWKEYQGKNVCALIEKDIEEWIRKANRIFYLRFSTIKRNITCILKYNPVWLKNLIRIFPIFFRLTRGKF